MRIMGRKAFGDMTHAMNSRPHPPRHPRPAPLRHHPGDGAGLGNPDVLPLWFGETDLVTPDFISDAAIQALDDDKTFYTNARGIQPLREAIAAFHKRTIGARHRHRPHHRAGRRHAGGDDGAADACETGDNVVIVSPIWPNIFQAAKVVGAEPRLVRLDEDWDKGRWSLDLDKLFAACDARTKAMFIASPGNPTGWMLTAAEQKTILDECRKRGIAIIADEVYGTLVYDGSAACAVLPAPSPKTTMRSSPSTPFPSPGR